MASHKWRVLALACLLAILAAGLVFARSHQPNPPLVRKAIGDGRILLVEGVTFGTNHHIGVGSPIPERVARRMPPRLSRLLAPRNPKTYVESYRPSLAIWLTAQDATSHASVDCGKLKLELLDEAGNRYDQDTTQVFGYGHLWRAAHIFSDFPRNEPKLKVRIRPFGGTNQFEFVVPNPSMRQPAA